MTPGSPELLARAELAKARWSDRVLTPYEAFAFIGDNDDVEVFDVRTAEQRASHAINERGPRAVVGSVSLPLDDIVSGAAPPPSSDLPLVLVCSKGPKSLVALDYLAQRCPRAVCVEGGINAWDKAVLPTEPVE